MYSCRQYAILLQLCTEALLQNSLLSNTVLLHILLYLCFYILYAYISTVTPSFTKCNTKVMPIKETICILDPKFSECQKLKTASTDDLEESC
jgi:predicted membrane protein